MPKERLHLLLADLTLQRMAAATGCPPIHDGWRKAFLHGAISPDLLFYDLPFFRLSAVGGRLHALMETLQPGVMPEPMRTLLETPERAHVRPWMLGMTHHFMVDQIWHPLINGYAGGQDTPCRSMGLNMRECHHWLESELESFWMSRLGPLDGYIPFLTLLKGDMPFRMSVGEAYEGLLGALSVTQAPSAAEITRCSTLQILLMLEFSRPAWGRLRSFLLSMRPTKYIGALIVPRYPCADNGIPKADDPAGIHRLWEKELVDRTISSITSEFLSLPGWS